MNAVRTTLLLFAALLISFSGTARAQSVEHSVTVFGDYVVEPGQTIDGDLDVVFGNATIEGTVNGDVNVVGGNVYERPGSVVTGRVNSLGGDVVRTVVPWVPSPAVRSALQPDGRVLWHIAWDVVVLLLFLIFPVRTRMALDRLERHPGLSVAAGTLGWIAVIPLAILLLVSIILIPVIPLEFVGVLAGSCIGTAALALLVGRRLYEMLNPSHTPAPLGALLIGLALLTAAELVPIVGALVTILVLIAGLGATILTLMNEHTFTGAGHHSGPPIGGPPMTAS